MFVALVVDEELPGESLAAGEWDRPKVDAEGNPEFAARGNTGRTSGFELTVQADRLLADHDWVAVFVGEVELPLVLHVRLVPGHADANRNRDVLRTGADHAESAAEDEQLAIGDLHRVAHQDDCSERWRVEGQIGLLHGDEPTGGSIRRMSSRVAAVILAAGSGSRYVGETHKLRAEIDEVSVLARSVNAARAVGFDEVFVVVGDDDFADILPESGVTVVPSPRWADGQAHSLQAAVSAAREKSFDAIIVAPGDQPLVGAVTWAALRDADATPFAVATYAGVQRPPTRLASSIWDDLPTEGDHGARAVMKPSPELVTEVPSAGSPHDVDTVEALEQVRQIYYDRIAVTELLGRTPMGQFEVVVRNDDGEPVVLKNYPLLANGRPMPTLYWLCGERESMLIGRLEAMKGVRRAEADIGLEAINAAHDRYCAERDAILDAATTQPEHRPTGGVGGTRNGVKCLHAHYGYWLAGGDDPVGKWVHDHLHEVDTPRWPEQPGSA